MEKETLEKVMKEKIEPMLEEAMQKYLGITVSELEKDITEKIESEPLIGFTIRTDLPFKEAKKLFKREFIQKSIQTHYGNISDVADTLGLDRRSIHRDIKSLNVDVKKLRAKLYKSGYFKREAMDSMIRKVLDQYKEVIMPEKLEKMYEEVPRLSKDIVALLPRSKMKWKEAENEFERVYLGRVLDEMDWNLGAVAKKIKIRYETLIRKMKRLELRKG